jgi:hypothetical protein
MLTTRWPDPLPGDNPARRHRLRGWALQKAWADLLSRVQWDCFVTLTFDPDRVYPVRRQKASRESFAWCNQTARMLRRPIGWIYASERGRAGQWHSHVLIVGASPECLVVPADAWRLRNGFVDVRRVDNSGRLALYATKSAALSGEIVWSETLTYYRDRRQPSATIALHAEC